jgi:hypothetical protein
VLANLTLLQDQQKQKRGTVYLLGTSLIEIQRSLETVTSTAVRHKHAARHCNKRSRMFAWECVRSQSTGCLICCSVTVWLAVSRPTVSLYCNGRDVKFFTTGYIITLPYKKRVFPSSHDFLSPIDICRLYWRWIISCIYSRGTSSPISTNLCGPNWHKDLLSLSPERPNDFWRSHCKSVAFSD